MSTRSSILDRQGRAFRFPISLYGQSADDQYCLDQSITILWLLASSIFVSVNRRSSYPVCPSRSSENPYKVYFGSPKMQLLLIISLLTPVKNLYSSHLQLSKMVSLKALVLALSALSSGVVAQVDSAQCSSLQAIASAGFSDSSSLSAFCTSVLSYTVPPFVAPTPTPLHHTTNTNTVL